MLISIGQFSKICSVSIKTLRYYDKVDLLKPAKVDELTGYRYYDENQLNDMLTINRLKRYGFPLIEIKAFLSSDDKRVLFSKLKERMTDMETEISHKSMLLKELKGIVENFERNGVIMNYDNNYDVNVKMSKELAVLSSRQRMSVEEFGKYYGELFTKIARNGITTTGEVIAIYHDDEFDENNSDIEVGIAIADKSKATNVLKSCLCATTVHKGSYANLTEAYASVVKWINANGYKITAPPYEIYTKSHVDNVPVSEWETEIYFPVEKL